MGRKLMRYVDSELKFDSKLVRMVKQYDHLFDSSHKLFEDVTTRIETWKYIGNALGIPETNCEKRWCYIINRFYDEILYMIKYNTPSLWLLFPQLDFLQDFIDLDDINSLCNEFLEFDTIVALEGA